MFVATLITLSKAELNSDSNYIFVSNTIRAALRLDPDVHFIVLWPDAQSGFKYDDDGFFRHRRITRVPYRTVPRKMANVVSFDAGWWDRFLRSVGVDIIWSNVAEVAHLLENMGAAAYMENARPVVVASHHYVIHSSLPYSLESQRHVLLSQLLGAYGARHNVFNSEHCQWMLEDSARGVLAEEAIADIRRRSTRIPVGIIDDALAPVVTDNPVPVVIYNHRLQAYKNYDQTFEVFDALHAEGVKFEVVVTSSVRENMTRLASRPYTRIELCPTREEYLRVLRTGDLNVTNSQHETFCMAAAESMALGQALVAPNGVTFPEITNAKANGYPYLYNSVEEEVGMVRALLTNAEERRRWGAALSEHVHANYRVEQTAQKYLNLFRMLGTYTFQTTADDALDMVRQRVTELSGNDSRTIQSSIWRTMVNGRHPFSDQSLTLTRLVRMARYLRFRVTMDGGVQRIHAK